MAKPIVVLYIPRNYFEFPDGDPSQELMRMLNGNYGEDKDTHKIHYPLYWTDYYWFVFPKEEITEPELQVFYEKDFTPIRFEELKKFIEDALKAKEE